MRNRLAEILEELNISPATLRDHLNVDRSNVYRWLINDTQPSDFNKKRISEFLNVSIGEIFFQENDARCAINNKSTGTEG